MATVSNVLQKIQEAAAKQAAAIKAAKDAATHIYNTDNGGKKGAE